jgi:hypothetical protein
MMRSKKWVVTVGWLVPVDRVKALKDIMPTGTQKRPALIGMGFDEQGATQCL